MTNEDNFSIDDELDAAFDAENEDSFDNSSSETDDFEENSNEKEENQFGEETLDDLMADSNETKAKKSDKNTKNVDTNEQNQQQQSNKSRRNNNSEDLVDKDGKIIAKAGAERRFYEENTRLKREKADFNQRILPTLRKNYDAMYAKCEAYEKTLQAMHADDLTPDDINTGIELIRQWHKSPEETIKMLLTQAKTYGINVDTGTSVDTAAIKQMISEEFRPFIEEREAAQREMQIQSRAREIYDNFFSKYPDAVNHKQEIGELLRRNPGQSLDAIYYQLKNHYLTKGFDFNTPLAEIYKQQQQQQTQKEKQEHSIGNVGVNQNIKTQNIQTPVASVNKSYDNIINSVMKTIKR